MKCAPAWADPLTSGRSAAALWGYFHNNPPRDSTFDVFTLLPAPATYRLWACTRENTNADPPRMIRWAPTITNVQVGEIHNLTWRTSHFGIGFWIIVFEPSIGSVNRSDCYSKWLKPIKMQKYSFGLIVFVMQDDSLRLRCNTPICSVIHPHSVQYDWVQIQ